VSNQSAGDAGTTNLAEFQGYVAARASLVHQMGRTWLARLSYSRDLWYLDGFLEPTLANWATAAISGAFSRRLDGGATASYTNGRIGLNTFYGYNVWTGGAGVRLALARRAVLFSRYDFMSHDFREGAPLPPGFPSQFDRHSVRVGISLWAPVVGRR
jgi:hypothetical protein